MYECLYPHVMQLVARTAPGNKERSISPSVLAGSMLVSLGAFEVRQTVVVVPFAARPLCISPAVVVFSVAPDISHTVYRRRSTPSYNIVNISLKNRRKTILSVINEWDFHDSMIVKNDLDSIKGDQTLLNEVHVVFSKTVKLKVKSRRLQFFSFLIVLMLKQKRPLRLQDFEKKPC